MLINYMLFVFVVSVLGIGPRYPRPPNPSLGVFATHHSSLAVRYN